jgi:hypothetical protein
MAEVPKDEPKKPYSTPVLTVHGTVRELTRKVGVNGHPDNGTPPFKFKSNA